MTIQTTICTHIRTGQPDTFSVRLCGAKACDVEVPVASYRDAELFMARIDRALAAYAIGPVVPCGTAILSHHANAA